MSDAPRTQLFPCDKCGKIFESEAAVHGHQVAHSPAYRKGIENRDLTGSNNPAWNGGGVEKSCEGCGETFTAVPANADRRRFCSYDCTNKWKSEEYRERDFGSRLPVLRGEENPNFGADLSGPNNPRWKEYPEITCEICGEIFRVRPAREDAARFCSRSCQNEWMSRNFGRLGMGDHLPVMRGEENPRWKGGYEPYYGPNWYTQRERALARDEFSCRICGKTEEEIGRSPDVHHIQRFGDFAEGSSPIYEQANRLSNLVTLCPKHHRKLEGLSVDEQKELLHDRS